MDSDPALTLWIQTAIAVLDLESGVTTHREYGLKFPPSIRSGSCKSPGRRFRGPSSFTAPEKAMLITVFLAFAAVVSGHGYVYRITADNTV